MATKVKGGAIKEGSIPLSALSEEIKNKIESAGGSSATPDWNAVEGEAGHIENKICRFMQYGREYKFTDTLRRADFTPIPNEYGEVYLYKKEVSYTGLQLVVTNMRVTDYGDTYSSALHTAGYVNGKYIVPFYGSDIATIWAEEDQDTYQGYLYVETTFSDSFPEDNTIFVVSHDEDYIEAEKLSADFIPNTVLKTIPQRLSDTDKNQALANLGIDPVVWKYICNPIVITSLDDTVPVDILETDDSDLTYIKPQYAGLIRGGFDVNKNKYVEACAVLDESRNVYDRVYIGDINDCAYLSSDGTFSYA